MSATRVSTALVLGAALALASALAAQAEPVLTAASAPGAREAGTATWYGEDFDGRLTANGERFDMYGLTAAHPTLPLGSLVEVTDLENGHKVLVRINDRRAPAQGGVIVLSKAAAANLGFAHAESAQVSLRLVQLPITITVAAKPLDKGWKQASAARTYAAGIILAPSPTMVKAAQ
jgi:rare lipoprotein A